MMQQRPRLKLLRQATTRIHDEVEEVVEAAGFFKSVAGYGQYLRSLHLFYRKLLSSVGEAGRAKLAAWQIEDRVEWLAEDLRALSLQPLPLPAPGAHMSRPLSLQEPARVLGALYVLLGASLGARVIIERVRNLPLPHDCARLYLARVGALSDWPRFLDTLEVEPLGSYDGLCRGAVDSFLCIHEVLSRAIPHDGHDLDRQARSHEL